MFDLGLTLTSRAIRRQLAAMPCDLYLVRLIHNPTKRPFPGERLWTATQLTHLATVRFLRARNREGCDVYIYPYASDRNAGYILVDLDDADPAALSAMCANGHEPCVVLQTSPGHWQAWVHVSPAALEPTLATAVGRYLAHLYGGDGASTDWRHLGRLAGFTNQKPQRQHGNGYSPWVKIVHTAAGLASDGERLLRAVREQITAAGYPSPSAMQPTSTTWQRRTTPVRLSGAQAIEIYQTWMRRWHIARRFPKPDWSIVDLWIARALLARGISSADVQQILPQAVSLLFELLDLLPQPVELGCRGHSLGVDCPVGGQRVVGACLLPPFDQRGDADLKLSRNLTQGYFGVSQSIQRALLEIYRVSASASRFLFWHSLSSANADLVVSVHDADENSVGGYGLAQFPQIKQPVRTGSQHAYAPAAFL